MRATWTCMGTRRLMVRVPESKGWARLHTQSSRRLRRPSYSSCWSSNKRVALVERWSLASDRRARTRPCYSVAAPRVRTLRWSYSFSAFPWSPSPPRIEFRPRRVEARHVHPSRGLPAPFGAVDSAMPATTGCALAVRESPGFCGLLPTPPGRRRVGVRFCVPRAGLVRDQKSASPRHPSARLHPSFRARGLVGRDARAAVAMPMSLGFGVRIVRGSPRDRENIARPCSLARPRRVVLHLRTTYYATDSPQRKRHRFVPPTCASGLERGREHERAPERGTRMTGAGRAARRGRQAQLAAARSACSRWVNQKGGVGKTTHGRELAASVAAAERRTSAARSRFRRATRAAASACTRATVELSVYDALIGRATLRDVIRPTELSSLKLCPSKQDLIAVEFELVDDPDRSHKLRAAPRGFPCARSPSTTCSSTARRRSVS